MNMLKYLEMQAQLAHLSKATIQMRIAEKDKKQNTDNWTAEDEAEYKKLWQNVELAGGYDALEDGEYYEREF